ncbi:hypothetical protein SKAU_G00368440 [Synaphobranchus kaupii]|uniref:Uncharacterized protein n=1 Tax=Synaphobranchus kaupii TaxID=118154 RepID=A0A9Q1EFL0_SYNKA|nr:hypothetical protein SKAU_G00368440 [Synaphobranchus kaupii]
MQPAEKAHGCGAKRKGRGDASTHLGPVPLGLSRGRCNRDLKAAILFLVGERGGTECRLFI